MQMISKRMEMLYNCKLLDGGTITYGEHRKHCNGCKMCQVYRSVEKEIKEQENLTSISKETGVPVDQIILGREAFEPDHIENYGFKQKDIYTKTGRINREVYLVLKYQGFIDQDIRDYFHVNANKWQNFKHREFPHWTSKEEKERIISEEAQAAYERWAKSPRNRRILFSIKC